MSKIVISDEAIQEAREVRIYQEDKSLKQDADEILISVKSLHKCVSPNHVRTCSTLKEAAELLKQILERTGDYD